MLLEYLNLFLLLMIIAILLHGNRRKPIETIVFRTKPDLEDRVEHTAKSLNESIEKLNLIVAALQQRLDNEGK